ncbi:hypothetical protein [Brumimicrobium aurantiacum]|uniref:FabZ n=1 Tax=Brumimicrobium aurantiacum TaxID=1737063 RepID=A0A3E1EZD1_9FLAO|nr:hypothetical protein [Brumimicrobium aurantiacum]RFC54906.1 hypothetical protein DXU93_03535 [Brumimicrobium aurantiacum]
MESIISEHEIQNLLPQKAPFTMVSHLLSFDSESIKTGLNIEDHNIFIEEGCFNESGMIENIAQSIALHIGYRYQLLNIEAPLGYIGAVNKVQLFKRPKVNSEIVTVVNVIKEFMGVTLVEGKVLCNDEIMLTASMKTVLSET